MTVDLELLTREELDAILAEAAQSVFVSAAEGRLAEPFRRNRPTERAERGEPAPELRRVLAEFAESWGSQLANRYQRRVSCSLIGWEEMDTFVFKESLIATDRPTLFELQAGAPSGFVAISRPLGFALLTLSFGGRRGFGDPVPERLYTKIEMRFQRHLVAQLLSELHRGWSAVRAVELRPTDSVTPDELVDRAASRVLLASLDVSGTGLEGRLRIAIPTSLAQARAVRESLPRPAGDSGLEAALVDLPLRVCAEVGHAELGLRRLCSLAPGDVLELRRSVPDGLLVRVEGRPKFRAVRGNVGGRLAVQVVARIDEGGRAS